MLRQLHSVGLRVDICPFSAISGQHEGAASCRSQQLSQLVRSGSHLKEAALASVPEVLASQWASTRCCRFPQPPVPGSRLASFSRSLGSSFRGLLERLWKCVPCHIKLRRPQSPCCERDLPTARRHRPVAQQPRLSCLCCRHNLCGSAAEPFLH